MAQLSAPEFDPGDDQPQVDATPSRRPADAVKDKGRLRFQPPPDAPFLTERDMVRVHNDDQKLVELAWDGTKWPIAPGQDALVPFSAVVNVLGDPRSQKGEMLRYTDAHGNRGVVPERYDNLRSLFARYGVRNENLDDESKAVHEKVEVPMTEPCSLIGRAPKLTVTTSKGMPLTFPAQIPDMLPYPIREGGSRAGVVDQRQALDRQIAENAVLKQRLDEIEAMLNERLGGATPDAGPVRPE